MTRLSDIISSEIKNVTGFVLKIIQCCHKPDIKWQDEPNRLLWRKESMSSYLFMSLPLWWSSWIESIKSGVDRFSRGWQWQTLRWSLFYLYFFLFLCKLVKSSSFPFRLVSCFLIILFKLFASELFPSIESQKLIPFCLIRHLSLASITWWQNP